jgi:hypothetical protein
VAGRTQAWLHSDALFGEWPFVDCTGNRPPQQTAGCSVMGRHDSEALRRRLSLVPSPVPEVCVRRQAAASPPAVGHHCSEGATSDRPRSISSFASGTREAQLRHACRPIKAERPITRAAQQVPFPPTLWQSPTLFRSAFNPRHPRLIRLPSRKRRASDRRSSCVWTLMFPSLVHAARSSLVQDSSLRLASFSTAVRIYSSSCRALAR